METEIKMSREPDPNVPWAIYDDDGDLVHVGLHTTHMAAWMAFMGEGTPYPDIIAKQAQGFSCKRVRITPIEVVVGLRRQTEGSNG